LPNDQDFVVFHAEEKAVSFQLLVIVQFAIKFLVHIESAYDNLGVALFCGIEIDAQLFPKNAVYPSLKLLTSGVHRA
jgi:uncharacterized membrane protein